MRGKRGKRAGPARVNFWLSCENTKQSTGQLKRHLMPNSKAKFHPFKGFPRHCPALPRPAQLSASIGQSVRLSVSQSGVCVRVWIKFKAKEPHARAPDELTPFAQQIECTKKKRDNRGEESLKGLHILYNKNSNNNKRNKPNIDEQIEDFVTNKFGNTPKAG